MSKVTFEISETVTEKEVVRMGHKFKAVDGKYQAQVYQLEGETMQRYGWGKIVEAESEEKPSKKKTKPQAK